MDSAVTDDDSLAAKLTHHTNMRMAIIVLALKHCYCFMVGVHTLSTPTSGVYA